ncbi:dihydrolipoamide acetyltransferase family protein [Zhihengliuella flava]|uniref:Dihydrolipoamide acetyltransferase component of pyruvate dehydrogenase complex n=1 Tax=Zhihengliuella flava TaxID=1285193 RepID=A0A931DC76_9MICC|nr:dihydrolipoamide acetyltransferase family protein [Zhihengliuella flava]MBG6084090.1 pyruvate dehydrogenase E2 component (dihydrolipoamide acetyltransferase) [Zhihengliuella flava]
MQTFNLPDLGEGLTEAELVSWHVAVGDTVVVDQLIAEVETAKSAVEVPCPFAGTVAELCGEPGQTLLVGAPLIRVAAEGSAPAADTHEREGAQSYAEEELAGVKAPAESPADDAAAESGSGNVLIGYGTPGGAGATKRRRAPKASGRANDAVPAPAAPAQTAAPAEAAAPALAPRVVNPIVRRMAREHGVDVARLQGTGEDGLILRADVEAAISGAPAAGGADAAPQAGATPSTSAAGTGEQDARTGLGVAERTPVRGVRKAIADAMTRSRDEIPEATVWVDVDATALLELRQSLKNSAAGAPGLLALMGRFVTAGLAKYPELNSRIEQVGDSQEIVRFDGVNLGFAAQTDRGLVVPAVEHAEALSARQLDVELRQLTAKAREGKCSPAELMRGTFTLNNYGVFGVDGSAAIINYPEVAILGVGRIIDKPWVVDGELTVRKVTVLTLAFDHRVCDGGAAGGFLRYIADAIENPGTVLADL